jgi:hypothetical protein
MASIYSKFSLTQASEFQILKEILQLLESQSSVQIIANENNNAIYYKIEIQSVLSNKLLLKYLNHTQFRAKMVCIKVYSRLHGYVERKFN